MVDETPRINWFGGETAELQLAQYFQRMESWHAAIADGVITPEEIREQGHRVIGLLKEVEPLVTSEQRATLTKVLYEMAVLQAMQGTAMASTLGAKS
jgi:hypothetical protein